MADSSGGKGRSGDGVLTRFMGELPIDLQESLSRNTRRVSYRRGSSVRLVGSAPRPGLVLDGLIRAYVATSGGREATVTYARPGYPIGMFARFLPESPLGLEAVEESTVLYFDSRRFEEAVSTSLPLAEKVAAWMADDVVWTSNTLLAFAFGSVRNRLASHLLSIASSADGDGTLAARVTQQQLANAIGSARQVVARSLSELVAEGLVRTARGAVVIQDEEALRGEAAPD